MGLARINYFTGLDGIKDGLHVVLLGTAEGPPGRALALLAQDRPKWSGHRARSYPARSPMSRFSSINARSRAAVLPFFRGSPSKPYISTLFRSCCLMNKKAGRIAPPLFSSSVFGGDHGVDLLEQIIPSTPWTMQACSTVSPREAGQPRQCMPIPKKRGAV